MYDCTVELRWLVHWLLTISKLVDYKSYEITESKSCRFFFFYRFNTFFTHFFIYFPKFFNKLEDITLQLLWMIFTSLDREWSWTNTTLVNYAETLEFECILPSVPVFLKRRQMKIKDLLLNSSIGLSLEFFWCILHQRAPVRYLTHTSSRLQPCRWNSTAQ